MLKWLNVNESSLCMLKYGMKMIVANMIMTSKWNPSLGAEINYVIELIIVVSLWMPHYYKTIKISVFMSHFIHKMLNQWKCYYFYLCHWKKLVGEKIVPKKIVWFVISSEKKMFDLHFHLKKCLQPGYPPIRNGPSLMTRIDPIWNHTNIKVYWSI